jgi:hypothetical protein
MFLITMSFRMPAVRDRFGFSGYASVRQLESFDVIYKYCNVLGFSSRWNFIALQKSIHYSSTQSETLGTRVHVRPARSRNTHAYRILPTGPLVAIFQHSHSCSQKTFKHTSGQSIVGLSDSLHTTTALRCIFHH